MSLGRRAFEALECRDFARADFRLDRDGRPHFLEMNPLPTFAPDGSFGIIAELLGRALDELLAEILAEALARLGLRAGRLTCGLDLNPRSVRGVARAEDPMSEQAYRDGLEVKRRLFGAGKERPVSHGSLVDDLLRLCDELVFGRVYTRPGLDLKTRSMLTVAALTVLGRDDYLRRHLQGALHVGVTPAEIKEILMQMAFYGGMPVALKALAVSRSADGRDRGRRGEKAR